MCPPQSTINSWVLPAKSFLPGCLGRAFIIIVIMRPPPASLLISTLDLSCPCPAWRCVHGTRHCAAADHPIHPSLHAIPLPSPAIFSNDDADATQFIKPAAESPGNATLSQQHSSTAAPLSNSPAFAPFVCRCQPVPAQRQPKVAGRQGGAPASVGFGLPEWASSHHEALRSTTSMRAYVLTQQ
ncbi:hypothetical protein VDGL01_01650 [Verticillium dahliae]